MPNNRNYTVKFIALFLIISILITAFTGCSGNKKPSGTDGSSSTVSGNESDLQNSSDSAGSVDKNNSNGSFEAENGNSSITQSAADPEMSDSPTVTLAAQVAPGICIVGGSCPKGSEYVTVKGDGVTTTKIVPYAGQNVDYFIGQVKFTKSTNVEVSAKEKGKTASYGVYRYVNFQVMTENYMEAHEYRPVIGLNSRVHFYSALLSYSLSADKLTSTMRSQAQTNITNLVNKASAVGAETIFLIIPSSAEIYPETVPAGYPKTKGETLYQAFEKIATNAGAKVIYPLSTMKKHKNDGKGYQIYQHTDSHWSTYGAYWGTYDMLNYISKSYPAAKPRTVKEMGFYTTELYGGDAIFNFPWGIGFESNTASGLATKTGIRELTNLYKLNTSTLSSIYHNNVGLYLTNDNAAAKTVYNKNPAGLPNAVIMRDSFGKVAYDMLSDRFATTCWGEFDNYNLPSNWQNTNPDYVIHLYSERNLLKIMLSNSGASIVNLK